MRRAGGASASTAALVVARDAASGRRRARTRYPESPGHRAPRQDRRSDRRHPGHSGLNRACRPELRKSSGGSSPSPRTSFGSTSNGMSELARRPNLHGVEVRSSLIAIELGDLRSADSMNGCIRLPLRIEHAQRVLRQRDRGSVRSAVHPLPRSACAAPRRSALDRRARRDCSAATSPDAARVRR